MRLCASDPLCAEHHPYHEGITLHAASCHACLFAPETSCERGNKYLDRSVLVPTVERADVAFFAESPAATEASSLVPPPSRPEARGLGGRGPTPTTEAPAPARNAGLDERPAY